MDRDGTVKGMRTLRNAGAEDLAAAAYDLSAAFVDDPILGWFMRRDARRQAARSWFFQRIVKDVAFPDGVIEIPDLGGAAAIWIPSEHLTAQPLHRELRALPMLLYATNLLRLRRLMALRNAMDARHPMKRPHDYLWFLGVHPDHQGGGLGSRLLKWRTDRLDAAGRCGFLETATLRNLPLYQRHGFEIVEDYQPAPDGPRIFGMWREPRTL